MIRTHPEGEELLVEVAQRDLISQPKDGSAAVLSPVVLDSHVRPLAHRYFAGIAPPTRAVYNAHQAVDHILLQRGRAEAELVVLPDTPDLRTRAVGDVIARIFAWLCTIFLVAMLCALHQHMRRSASRHAMAWGTLPGRGRGGQGGRVGLGG